MEAHTLLDQIIPATKLTTYCAQAYYPQQTFLTGTQMKKLRRNVTWFLAAALILISTPNTSHAQAAGQPPPDHPSITVHGRTYTPRAILARNMGTPDDQTTQFPPHKIVGNLYYV